MKYTAVVLVPVELEVDDPHVLLNMLHDVSQKVGRGITGSFHHEGGWRVDMVQRHDPQATPRPVLIGEPAQQLLDLFAAADADTALQLNIACAAAAEIARICTGVRDSCCYNKDGR